MKVILSTSAIRYPLTGIGRYVLELARHLPQQSQVSELRFLHGMTLRDTLPTAPGTAPAAAAGLAHRVRNHLAQNHLALALYGRLMPHLEGRALRGHADAVVHGPNFFLPACPNPRVVTVHDLSMFSWAHCHTPQHARFMQAQVRRSVAAAHVVVTDSEFVRREIISFFGLPSGRVFATPLAGAAEFHPRDAAALMAPLARHGLAPGGYTLFTGTIEPRKNVDALLSAYEALPDALRRRWPLVLAGYKGWAGEATWARIARARDQGWARYLGYVSGEDLPLLFAGARLFVFPSHYEGFGLPVLEAMQSGVPVVCSNAASLPEVAGDAAAMCTPDDVQALRQAICVGLEDDAWRARAQAAGLARAQGFSWGHCAAQTVQAYSGALRARAEPQ